MSSSPALARVATALALCLVAGVCLAGLAFPLIGSVGLLGKSASDDFMALPSKLETPALAQRSRILDRDGHVLATLFTENRVQVTLAQVPKTAQDALIAIEDSRFREHRGIDVKGTIRAIARNSSSGSVHSAMRLTSPLRVVIVAERMVTSRSGWIEKLASRSASPVKR